jgi:hypothetical protein
MSDTHTSPIDSGSGQTLIIDLRELLSLELDPGNRLAIRRLLVEEMERLANQRIALADAERCVREGRARIERAKTTKRAYKNLNEHGLVNAMEVTQSLLENFHNRLLKDFPESNELHNAIVAVCVSIQKARQRA